MTNGKWQNYALHAVQGAVIGAAFGWALSPIAGAMIAVVRFHAREEGEQTQKIDWRQRTPLTDINPFHRNWSADDRADFISGALGGIAGALIAALI